jgi:hypothetical protein
MVLALARAEKMLMLELWTEERLMPLVSVEESLTLAWVEERLMLAWAEERLMLLVSVEEPLTLGQQDSHWAKDLSSRQRQNRHM